MQPSITKISVLVIAVGCILSAALLATILLVSYNTSTVHIVEEKTTTLPSAVVTTTTTLAKENLAIKNMSIALDKMSAMFEEMTKQQLKKDAEIKELQETINILNDSTEVNESEVIEDHGSDSSKFQGLEYGLLTSRNYGVYCLGYEWVSITERTRFARKYVSGDVLHKGIVLCDSAFEKVLNGEDIIDIVGWDYRNNMTTELLYNKTLFGEVEYV